MSTSKNVIEIILKAIDNATPEIKKAMGEVEKSNKKASEGAQKVSADFDKMAMASGVAFAGLSMAMRELVQESEEVNNSLIGLTSIAEGVGINADLAKQAAKDLAADGLMTIAEAATSLKNLLARGFNLEQATDLMNRFKDSASFGRQASLGFGQAIKGATEGLKNENSVLVDNAGVTKNVSKMWEDYAKAHGKSVNELSKAEKLQAEYNGILEETRFQVGDAAKLAGEFSGQMSKTGAETKMTAAEIGDNLKPVLRDLLAELTSVISGVREFNQENPKMVASTITGTTAAMGMATVFSTLAIVVKAVNTAIGGFTSPLGVAFVAVTTLTGIVAALNTQLSIERVEMEKARKATIEQANSTFDLSRRYDELKEKYDDANISAEEKKAIEIELRGIAAQLQASSEDLKGAYDAEKTSLDLITDAKEGYIRKTEEEIQAKINNARATIKETQAEIEKLRVLEQEQPKSDFSGAALEGRMFTYQERIKRLEVEIDEYATTLERRTSEAANAAGKAAEEAAAKAARAAKEAAQKAAKASEEARKKQVDSINRLYDSLKSSLKKHYEEQEEEQTAAIDRELEKASDATEKKLELYDKEYRAKLKALNAESAAAIEALENQIEAIDEQTDQEEKAQRQREQQQKIANLQAKLLTETDANEKARIQAELNKELEDQQRRKILDERQSQKDAIRDEIERIRDQVNEKRDLLQDEYEDQRKAEQEKLKNTVDRLNNERQEVQNHYDRLKEEAEIAAQAQKMIWDNNQKEIVELLKEYEPDWLNQGKSFGERLLEGFKSVSFASAVGNVFNGINVGGGTGPGGGGGTGGGSGNEHAQYIENNYPGGMDSYLSDLDRRASEGTEPNIEERVEAEKERLGVAHKGGVITENGIIPLPELKPGEVPIIAQSGETVYPRGAAPAGAGGLVLKVTITGNTFFSERDFERKVESSINNILRKYGKLF